MIFGAENSIQLARFRAVALAEDTLLCKAKQRTVAGFQPTRNGCREPGDLISCEVLCLAKNKGFTRTWILL